MQIEKGRTVTDDHFPRKIATTCHRRRDKLYSLFFNLYTSKNVTHVPFRLPTSSDLPMVTLRSQLLFKQLLTPQNTKNSYKIINFRIELSSAKLWKPVRCYWSHCWRSPKARIDGLVRLRTVDSEPRSVYPWVKAVPNSRFAWTWKSSNVFE